MRHFEGIYLPVSIVVAEAHDIAAVLDFVPVAPDDGAAVVPPRIVVHRLQLQIPFQ